MANYDGLTRNPWPGTWSTNGVHPIALDVELRGGLRLVSGSGTDTLVNIPSGMLQDGMLAYVASGYHASVSGDTYYKYSILSGESRDTETGFLPNDSGNWSVLSFGNGDALAVSGWADSTISAGDAAVSGWAQAYVDGQDHSATAVSGWAESYIDTTSGNLQSQINENASGIEAVQNRTYNNISSDFSMSDDSDVIFIDSTSSPVNIYLPTADGVGGKQLLFKMVSGSNSGVLVASGTQSIDGQSSFGIYSIYESISVISNNSNWFVI